MGYTIECSGSGAPCASFAALTKLIVNTTSTSDCVTVGVRCPDGSQQLANQISVYRCHDGAWSPFTPLPCIDEYPDGIVNKGVIIGCAFGALVCIVIIIYSILMFGKLRKEDEEDEERHRAVKDKMKYVREYAESVSNSYRSTQYLMNDDSADEIN